MAEFLASLRVTLAPIAKDTCDHAQRTSNYVIPRKLKHLSKPADPLASHLAATGPRPTATPTTRSPGRPDELRVQPRRPCRYHHRCKQAADWELTQPHPGIFRWKHRRAESASSHQPAT